LLIRVPKFNRKLLNSLAYKFNTNKKILYGKISRRRFWGSKTFEQNLTNDFQLHIILMPRNVNISEHSIFQLLNQNMFNGKLKIRFFIDMLDIFFKFRNSEVDLKDNFDNN